MDLDKVICKIYFLISQRKYFNKKYKNKQIIFLLFLSLKKYSSFNPLLILIDIYI